jgi:hypothetical protein
MSDKCIFCNIKYKTKKNDVDYIKCSNLCIDCCCMQPDCETCEKKQGGKIDEIRKEAEESEKAKADEIAVYQDGFRPGEKI